MKKLNNSILFTAIIMSSLMLFSTFATALAAPSPGTTQGPNWYCHTTTDKVGYKIAQQHQIFPNGTIAQLSYVTTENVCLGNRTLFFALRNKTYYTQIKEANCQPLGLAGHAPQMICGENRLCKHNPELGIIAKDYCTSITCKELVPIRDTLGNTTYETQVVDGDGEIISSMLKYYPQTGAKTICGTYISPEGIKHPGIIAYGSKNEILYPPSFQKIVYPIQILK